MTRVLCAMLLELVNYVLGPVFACVCMFMSAACDLCLTGIAVSLFVVRPIYALVCRFIQQKISTKLDDVEYERRQISDMNEARLSWYWCSGSRGGGIAHSFFLRASAPNSTNTANGTRCDAAAEAYRALSHTQTNGSNDDRLVCASVYVCMMVRWVRVCVRTHTSM